MRLTAWPLIVLGLALALPTAPRRPAAHPGAARADIYIRVNFEGYRPEHLKRAVVFSADAFDPAFEVVDAGSGRRVLAGLAVGPAQTAWGAFAHHAEADFSGLRTEGTYSLRIAGAESPRFRIAATAYRSAPDALLEFMRQQRCGYNPFLDTVCHPMDGRTAFGPMPDGTFVDATGGWHDAGDSLKYLITSSNAVAQMLLAWRLAPAVFGDAVNGLGQRLPNGQPDVLDEAQWGIEWMLKLHPAPDQLFHQVADDRDHSGWRLPQEDESDYGWGKGKYRVLYFATGKPQGLKKYLSESDGVANIAGRYAAAMALAWDTWKGDPARRPLAERCLKAGVEVYALGRAKEGVQQGNSYGAPYRYNESTWADDMEWGAAELFRATGERRYLDDARRYARLIASTGWMGRDTAAHYEYYPFMNLGHFALHQAVGADRASRAGGRGGLSGEAARALRVELARYYEEGLEAALGAAKGNPWLAGTPFIWCSNNLAVALATQGLLYARMTGDTRYAALTAAGRDWLLGRNPWGTSMFTGFPADVTSPTDPHLIPPDLTHRPVRGGLVDGPVAESIFKSLKGVALSRPDAFAAFQSAAAVYHDDKADYSTNEPTMDGTASAILLLALIGG
jgi:endoglucanase